MRNLKKMTAAILVGGMAVATFAGCSSNNTKSDNADNGGKQSNVSITLLNSKGEIQEGLEAMAKEYEKKTGVKIEVMACASGESPFQKISSMYSAGNPPTLAILDTTDVKELAEEKAVDLSDEKWIADTERLIAALPAEMPLRGSISSMSYHSSDIQSRKSSDGF